MPLLPGRDRLGTARLGDALQRATHKIRGLHGAGRAEITASQGRSAAAGSAPIAPGAKRDRARERGVSLSAHSRIAALLRVTPA
jgi:hypothetical protein